MLALSEQSDRVLASLDNGSRDSGVAPVPSVGFLNTMATTAVRGQGGKPKAGLGGAVAAVPLHGAQ